MNQVYHQRVAGGTFRLMVPPDNFHKTRGQVPMFQKTGPHLRVINPEHRKMLEQQMEKFFFGEGADAPEGYVPPKS